MLIKASLALLLVNNASALSTPAMDALHQATQATQIKTIKWPFDADVAQARWGHDAQRAELAKTPRGKNETFTFSLIGDSEPGRFWFERVFPPKGKKVFQSLMTDMQDRSHDFVLQLGDFVSRGTPKNYAKFIEKLEAVADRPFFPIIGNHDRKKTNPKKPADRSLYKAAFASRAVPSYRNTDFFFEHGGYRIVCLDDSGGALSEDQLTWLDSVLDTDQIKIVALHIPPAYLKGRWALPAEMPEQGAEEAEKALKTSRAYFGTGAREFSEIVSRRGVERVYMGHIHALAYAEYAGVRYVLSGGGGSPLYSYPGSPGQKISHYIMVEAGPEGVRETIVTSRGEEMAFAAL
ncbi:MAG: hypothetical protein COB53_02280 [Elusimicrobia bacterium]|nr:MAG: hypothetical protein COB53_02280 [Elusimicrobiota bacterium]